MSGRLGRFLERLRAGIRSARRPTTAPRAAAPPSATRSTSARAWAFETPLSLEAMQRLLNESGPWEWHIGDSAWYGDYLAASARPHVGALRIYEEGQRFVAQIRYRGSQPTRDDFEALRARVVEELLPQVRAEKIEPHEGFD